MPLFNAIVTAWVRSLAPSFERIFLTWALTVSSVIARRRSLSIVRAFQSYPLKWMILLATAGAALPRAVTMAATPFQTAGKAGIRAEGM